MPEATGTSYETGIRFTVDAHGAIAGIQQVAKATEAAAAHQSKFANALDRGKHLLREHAGEMLAQAAVTAGFTAGIGGVGSAFEAVKERMVEAVGEMHAVEKSLAGVNYTMLQFPRGTSEVEKAAQSFEMAKEQAEDLEKVSRRFAIPLTEMASSYRSVSVAAGPVVKTQERVLALTEDVAAASKVFGVSAEGASMGVGRAIQTGVLPRMGVLGSFLKDHINHWRQFSHMKPEARYEAIHKALQAAVPMADRLSHSMNDSLFRIRSHVDEIMRSVGGPMVEHMAEKLSKWAERMSTLSADGRTGFEAIGDAIGDAMDKLEDFVGMIGEIKIPDKVAGFFDKLSGGWAFGIEATRRRVMEHDPNGAENYVRELQKSRENEMTASEQSLRPLMGRIGNLEYAEAHKGKKPGKGLLGMREEFGKAALDIPDYKAELRKYEKSIKAAVDSGVIEQAAASVKLEQVASIRKELDEIRHGKKKGGPEYSKGGDVNIGTLNLTQKFDEVDPDRIFVRFREGLEGLSERPNSSSASGLPHGM